MTAGIDCSAKRGMSDPWATLDAKKPQSVGFLSSNVENTYQPQRRAVHQ
jgi:hypothetical protein